MPIDDPPRPSLLERASFLRATLVLVGGTAGAQLITASMMPVLSRLYTPAEFGLLAVFSGLLTTLAVAACLRFDIAVAIPESDQDALGLLILSLSCAALVSLVILLIIGFGHREVASWLKQPRIEKALWLLPIGVFTTAAYSAMQNWNIRRRSFDLISHARIGQSLAGGGTQIVAGLAGLGSVGLIIGYVINSIAGVSYLAVRAPAPSMPAAMILTRRNLIRLVGGYRRFPMYSTWEALANTAAITFPIMIVAAEATAAEAGFLVMAMYVVQSPMSLIGSAVAQVYLSRAPLEYSQGRLGPFTIEVLSNLIKAGLGPLLAIGLVAPVAFALIFGPEWARAGWLVAWMIPWFVLQFLVSPVSMALHVTGHQRAAMAMQLFGLCVRVASVWGAARWWSGAMGETYALSGLVVYAVYLGLVLRILSVTPRQLLRATAKSMPISAFWVTGAALLTLVLSRFGHGR